MVTKFSYLLDRIGEKVRQSLEMKIERLSCKQNTVHRRTLVPSSLMTNCSCSFLRSILVAVE